MGAGKGLGTQAGGGGIQGNKQGEGNIDYWECQTPAGQPPQSVFFKLRSRLADSARPEQSTTRQICLSLPVAQPTAVGDARQEPPLRISRAAGHGERYGRAASTQDKKKELSSYVSLSLSSHLFPMASFVNVHPYR